MFLIAESQDGFRAIPVDPRSRWELRKLFVGRREIRVILRVRGRQYVLYSTRGLASEHPALHRDHLDALCDDLIAMVSDLIRGGNRYVEFPAVAARVEETHRRKWGNAGLIIPQQLIHPTDPMAECLVTHVRVEHTDVIEIPTVPETDTEQGELPY